MIEYINAFITFTCRFEYFTSSELSKRFPKSLRTSDDKLLVGCNDYEAGLLMADKALLALWVSLAILICNYNA